MPAGLDTGDRKILIIAAALLLLMTVAALLVTPPAGVEDSGIPTSYSAGSSGVKAAFLLLKELDYDVARWESSPLDLPQEAAGVTLILASPNPRFAPSAEERQAVHRFVRNGGHVLAILTWDTRFVPDAPEQIPNPNFGDLDSYPFSPQAASPLVEGAQEIHMAQGPRYRSAVHEYIPVYGDAEGAVVVTYRAGEGRVTLWSTATPLTNAGIRIAGNLNLFLNSVGDPENEILWDEYFHGRHGSLWTYLGKTPVPWALLQVGLAAIAIFLGFARRHGPVRKPESESRLSPLEFVSTLGGLYQRARASGTAVAIAHQRFRHLLAKRLGVAASAPAVRLHEGARDHLGWKQPGLLAFLQRCERAQRDRELDDTEALAIVQGLAHYTQLLRLGSSAAEPSTASKEQGKT